MNRPAGRQRPPWRTMLFIVLLISPIAEIAVIVGVGRVIGSWQTLALLVVVSTIGAWLVRREGSSAWRALRVSLQTGRMPGRELTDAALILVGGTLLLTPGFLTDLVGFALIAPPTRPLARRWLQVIVERRLAQRAGIIRGDVV
ncbi:MAG TPA: FxsA family protein [Dermatophilaceae bacterium]|nr:FxsA family protein [Dermatophilaceae bacterium]